MSSRSILLRYHEIALKGDNRAWFEDRLAINARKMLKRVHKLEGKDSEVIVKKHHGRIELEADWNENTRNAMMRIFGLSSFSPMLKVKTDKALIAETLLTEFERYVQTHGMPKTFRVKTKRSEKAFPESSVDLDRHFGTIIKNKYPSLVVDLKNPEMTLGIELRFNETFLWNEKIQGPGGLPVGSNARVLTLISGGLDSPVAAIQVLKRGSVSSLIHFYGAPFVGEEVLTKIEDLVRVINRYQPDFQPLLIVPFGKIQEQIALATPPKMRTLLYRRMMIRIANQVAQKIGAQALVTGESLGQVASQTVENIATINSASQLPILRPLITFDKDEIIEQAKKWGSFEISIRPGLDCCTLFSDKHPTLRSSLELLEEQESKFPVQEMVEEALKNLKVKKVF